MAVPNSRVFEMVDYRIDDIAHATVSLVTNIAVYSGLEGAESWLGSLMNMIEKIKAESPNTSSFKARGLALSFSGIPHALIPSIVDNNVVFKTKEPRFTFTPIILDLPRSKWEYVEKVTDEISNEMCEVYHMKRDGKRHLVFPNNEYAKTTIYDISLVH